MKQTHLGAVIGVVGLAASASAQSVYLNEIYASHVGTDTLEFIELIGAPATPLSNLMVLVVEGDGTGAGVLDRAWDLTGSSIPADGFFVLGDTAVPTLDFDIGASDRIENGTETFYLINATTPASVVALVGTNVKIAAGVTSIPTLGTILDVVGMVDGGYPNTDEIFDGATPVGPDGTFFPPGIYRDADYPRGWSTSQLEFDLDTVLDPYAPRTPGSLNPPNSPWVRVSEYMYNGDEFVEYTNIGTLPADLTGWSYDDDSNQPGVVPLSAFGSVAPGESVILAEESIANFTAAWGLPGTVKVIGGNTVNLGQNDRINLFAPNGYVVDRISYGTTTNPGSYRALNFSVWPCADALGTDNIYAWVASIVGDDQSTIASANGHLASPGTFVAVSPCADWLGLGNAKMTSLGTTPVLTGKGTQQDGDLISLVIGSGPPSALCGVIVGLANVGLSYGGGGILIPSPDVVIVAAVDGTGSLTLTTPWPAGVPSGFDLYYQVLFDDPAASAALSATNAYGSTTP